MHWHDFSSTCYQLLGTCTEPWLVEIGVSVWQNRHLGISQQINLRRRFHRARSRQRHCVGTSLRKPRERPQRPKPGRKLHLWYVKLLDSVRLLCQGFFHLSHSMLQIHLEIPRLSPLTNSEKYWKERQLQHGFSEFLRCRNQPCQAPKTKSSYFTTAYQDIYNSSSKSLQIREIHNVLTKRNSAANKLILIYTYYNGSSIHPEACAPASATAAAGVHSGSTSYHNAVTWSIQGWLIASAKNDDLSEKMSRLFLVQWSLGGLAAIIICNLQISNKVLRQPMGTVSFVGSISAWFLTLHWLDASLNSAAPVKPSTRGWTALSDGTLAIRELGGANPKGFFYQTMWVYAAMLWD